MCAGSHVLFCDKLCLGCAVRFLETAITATHRVAVTFLGLARTVFYLGLQSWGALLTSHFIWIDRYLSNSFLRKELLHPSCPYLVLKNVQNDSEISSSYVWYSVFTRSNHEGTGWWFLPCSLWILSSWIQMPDPDWSVFSTSGTCSELLLASALWKMS